MSKREIAEGVVTAHMMRQVGNTAERRPAVVVEANYLGGLVHCICPVPPGMTPPNGSKVRVVVPSNPFDEEFWYLAPKAVAA